MLKHLTLMVLLALLTACAPAAPQPTATPENRATATPENTPTPPPTATETPTATPTEAPAEQIDLKPNYEQKVAVEYMGVQINASLITDQSLDPVITKVTVGEKAYAEFLARSLYKVWLKKGGPEGTGPATAATFEQFMALWSTAQQSGQEADWRQVQIKKIWANEIATPGYEQHPYTIWFMHAGETPEDVRGVEKFTIALVNGSKVQNILPNGEDYLHGAGAGSNIDNNGFYVYMGIDFSFGGKGAVFGKVADTSNWLIRNAGNPKTIRDGSLDQIMYKFLKNAGMKVE